MKDPAENNEQNENEAQAAEQTTTQLGSEPSHPSDPKKSHTVYDDTYRTLGKQAPLSFIPLAQYCFGEIAQSCTDVRVLDSAHPGDLAHPEQGATTIYSDLALGFVRDEVMGFVSVYELQARWATDVPKRLGDYAWRTAHEAGTRNADGTNQIFLPHASVIVLQGPASAPDAIKMTTNLDWDAKTSDARVLKMYELDGAEITKNELYVLLPYHVFRYRSQLDTMELGSQAYITMEQDFAQLWRALQASTLELREKAAIAEATRIVISHLSEQYPILEGLVQMADIVDKTTTTEVIERNRVLEEEKRTLAEKYSTLEEENSALAEKNSTLEEENRKLKEEISKRDAS